MSTRRRILIVDDDPSLLKLLTLRLQSAGHDVATADDGVAALARIAERRPDAVITDVRMSRMDGMALLDAIRRDHRSLPVVILTAHGTIPDALEAMKRGVVSYLTKPFDSGELLAAVEEALRGQPELRAGEHILTRSERMRDLIGRTHLVAASEASVLIQGESGTGKELLARELHARSPRARRAFVAINCAAVPEALLESELFGHRRGAFTGAVSAHDGLFVAADGGTLFLDEVADMPLPFQAKLLRALQEGEVRPVGATRSVPVDVRVVSATHTDLEAAVADGSFREDLLYRLNVVGLRVPPLRERREDIPLLARHFLDELARRDQRAATLPPEAIELLVAAAWPGNVRQLRNVVERCFTLTVGPLVPVDLVREALRADDPALPTLDEAIRVSERDYLVKLLQLTGGNVSWAARTAGRNRTEFYRLLGRHGLDPTRFRDDDPG